jgi:hypothetical protein
MVEKVEIPDAEKARLKLEQAEKLENSAALESEKRARHSTIIVAGLLNRAQKLRNDAEALEKEKPPTE